MNRVKIVTVSLICLLLLAGAATFAQDTIRRDTLQRHLTAEDTLRVDSLPQDTLKRYRLAAPLVTKDIMARRIPAATEMPRVAVRNDLSVRVKATIDLNRKKAKSDFSIRNLKGKPTILKLTSPGFLARTRELSIAANDTQKTTFSEDIAISVLTARTRFASVSPYLLLREEGKTDGLLIADHSIDLTVRLPRNARIVKSSVPLEVQPDNTARLRMDGVKTVPPLYIWYTDAEEVLTVTKTITETENEAGENEINVRVDVKNEGQRAVSGIYMTSQFPATFYAAMPEKSDGEFVIEQDVMIRWKATINTIDGNATASVSFTMTKEQKDIPVKNPEVLVYNKSGDLIAVE